MGFFTPGMFRRRTERGPASPTPEQEQEASEAPAPPPAVCDVCGEEGHAREACWSAIRTREDLPRHEGRWFHGGEPEGHGDTLDAVRSFWHRIMGA